MIKLFFKTLSLLFLPFLIQAQTPDLNSSVPVDPTVKIGKLPNGLTYYIKKMQNLSIDANCVWL